MESFDYILPSNTSSERYPNNSASNYTTVPHNPLDLQGSWEVGVKSVFYNSHIGDQQEKATIKLKYEKRNTTCVNDVYPVTYKVTKDNTWDYSWRKVPSFQVQPPASRKRYQMKPYHAAVTRTLNQWNDALVARGRNVFSYSSHYPYVYYYTDLDGFSMQFKHIMARFLGYRWRVYLSKYGRFRIRSQIQHSAKLTDDDFYIKIFDRNVVKRHARVILKSKGESVLSHAEFHKRWQERIIPHVKCNVEFTKSKLIIHLYDNKAALTFNACLLDTIRCEESLFGYGTYWANEVYYPRKGGIKPEEDDWIVDIYKDELKTTTTIESFTFNYECYPRHYPIPRLLSKLSRDLTLLVQHEDGTNTIQFSFFHHYIKLQLPDHTQLELSPNLVNILGFDQSTFQGATHLGSILPATLDKREQEIFIYLDIADLMNFGNEKRPMIQHFVHSKNASYGIVERFFDPIIYQPVAKNVIESLTLQFLGNQQQLLTIKDSKSIVTLHFRKTAL